MARIVVALLVSVPVSALLWFQFVYLWYGLTARDVEPFPRLAIALVSLGACVAWSLAKGSEPAHAALRASRLGIAVAMALFPVTIAVLLIWQSASNRPDLGMGGLMLYSLPVVALIAAVVLIAIFAGIRRLAERRISPTAPGRPSHQS